MTWEGYNYEDAVLLSERLVRDDVYTSPARTSAPIRIIPSSSRSLIASLATEGISLVISSGPSLVSLASVSYS